MTTTQTNDLGPCRMCNQSHDWHQNNYSRHAYTPANAPGELRDATSDRKAIRDDSDARITRSTVPFDPALRLCLIENGVITIQQLADAEEKLRIVNRLAHEAMGVDSDEEGR
jgi:hypothetical protein